MLPCTLISRHQLTQPSSGSAPTKKSTALGARLGSSPPFMMRHASCSTVDPRMPSGSASRPLKCFFQVCAPPFLASPAVNESPHRRTSSRRAASPFSLFTAATAAARSSGAPLFSWPSMAQEGAPLQHVRCGERCDQRGERAAEGQRQSGGGGRGPGQRAALPRAQLAGPVMRRRLHRLIATEEALARDNSRLGSHKPEQKRRYQDAARCPHLQLEWFVDSEAGRRRARPQTGLSLMCVCPRPSHTRPVAARASASREVR